MRRFNCPSCDANLTIEDDNCDFAFCNYCGARIMLDDFRSTHRRVTEHRYIDETEIFQAEAQKAVELKKLENERKQAEHDRRIETIKLVFLISAFVVFFYKGFC